MASFFQFSVRSLLVGLTIACVGIAALLNAGPWWEAAVWSGTLLILSFSILLIVYRRREGRSFWLGFAVLGWLYAGVVVHSWTPYANPNYTRRDPLAQQSLITTRLAQLAYDSLLPKTKTQQRIPPPATATNQGLSKGEVFMANEAAGAGNGAAGALLQLDVLTFTTLTAGTTTILNADYVPIASFLHIAHALWLLLIAVIGGKTCQLIYHTRPNTEE